jgi:tetratricopeptide (TPR) repeat protein
MWSKNIIIGLIAFCLFISYQNTSPSNYTVHALIAQRIKEAGTRNYTLLEKTLEEVKPHFSTETDTLAMLYHRLATAYFNRDLELKALPIYEKALEIRRKVLKHNDFDLSKTLQGYGRTLARVRRGDEGLPLLAENLKIRQSIFPPQSDSIAEALMIYGGGCNESGDYNKAITHIQQAITIFQSNKRDTSRWAYALQYLGVSYTRSKQYEKAIQSFTESVKLMESIGDTKGNSESSHNIGYVLMEQQQYAAALPYLEKAYNLYPHSEYLNNLAQAHNQLKQYNKAHQYINQSLDFAQKNQSLCYLYIPRIYVTLGDIFTGENKPSEALSAYNQALQLFLNDSISIKKDPLSGFRLSDFGFRDDTQNPKSDKRNPINGLASCRPDVLKVLRQKNTPLSILHKKTQDPQYLKLQLDNYRACETLVRDLLQSFTEENSRFFWTDNVKDIYENGIKIALALKDYDAALAFAESSKAFNLLSEIQNNRAKRFGGVPDTLLARERGLKSTIAFWQKIALDPATDSNRIAQSRNGLFQAKQDFEGFQKQLEKNYPKYHNLKSPPPPLSISAVQATLNDSTVAIEYFLGDSSLFTFAFTKNSSQVFEQKLTPDVFQNIANLRRSTGDYKFIKNQPDSAQMLYLRSARALYKTLLESPLSKMGFSDVGFSVMDTASNRNPKPNTQYPIKRLRIISDGALGYIPFDMLLTADATSWRGENTPWLLQKMAVSYAYSNRFLSSDTEGINPKSETQNTINNDFGGFGISYEKDQFYFSEKEKQNEKVTALQYTVGEVRSIKSLLGGNEWLDKEATKKVFTDNASKKSILHLAMHGFLDTHDPLNSGLIFSRETPTDTTNYLTGYDLYATQLKAKLGVLSACNTGDGQLKGREGIMSLARSFAFAGCESLVMSLWSVPDKTTSDIMVKFYENLKQGQPKDIALQNAKLFHLKNAEPSRRVPNNWAAMVVIGNVEALTWEGFEWGIMVWGLFTMGVLALLFYFIKKKSRQNLDISA